MKPVKKPACQHGKSIEAAEVVDSARIDRNLAATQEVAKPTPADVPKFIVLTPKDLAVLSGCEGPGTEAVTQLIADQLLPILCHGSLEKSGDKSWLVDAMLATFRSEKPENATQALLLSQCLATHRLAFTFTEKSLLQQGSDPEGAARSAARAERLMSLFCVQAETLARLKGAPRQKITIEHLRVEAGGRAVLAGQINAKSGDGEGV